MMDAFTLVIVFLGFCLTTVALAAIGRSETEIAKNATRAIAAIGQEALRIIGGVRGTSLPEHEEESES